MRAVEGDAADLYRASDAFTPVAPLVCPAWLGDLGRPMIGLPWRLSRHDSAKPLNITQCGKTGKAQQARLNDEGDFGVAGTPTKIKVTPRIRALNMRINGVPRYSCSLYRLLHLLGWDSQILP